MRNKESCNIEKERLQGWFICGTMIIELKLLGTKISLDYGMLLIY